MADLKKELSTVDAIMQGAITNWANFILKMNTFKGESGLNTFLTPGKAAEFARSFIGAKISIDIYPTNDDLSSIDYNTHYVMGLVNCDFDEAKFTPGLSSNHYVNILGISNDEILFWSWGSSDFKSDASSWKGNGVHELLIFDR